MSSQDPTAGSFNIASEHVHSPLFDILKKALNHAEGAKMLADYLAAGNAFNNNARDEHNCTEAMVVATYAGCDGLMMMVLYGGDLNIHAQNISRHNILRVAADTCGQEGMNIIHEHGIEAEKRRVAMSFDSLIAD